MVEPRDAASLIVVRGEALLMGRRAAGHRFMPNVLVFPGGAVDPADYAAGIGAGLAPPVRAQLAAEGGGALADALAVAAARELEEEVGLSLGQPPALDGLLYLCRAITPPDHRMRFDARFFVVEAAQVQGEPRGSPEIERPGFVAIEDALAEDLALATRAVIEEFRRWRAAPEGWRPRVLRERQWQEA